MRANEASKSNDHPRVSVRLASKRPFLGRFGALSDGASRDVIARMGGRFVPPAQG